MSPDADAVVMNRLEGRLREAERQRNRLAEALRDLLVIAEYALPAFGDGRCAEQPENDLCHMEACKACGCIEDKLTQARARLAELEKP